MKRPAYSSPTRGALNRFPKMPRKEGTTSTPQLPRHPRRLAILSSLCSKVAIEHLDTEGPWGDAAFQVWESLIPLRNAAQQAAQR